MLVLELMLKGSDGKKVERVVIEMNMDEAKAFVGRLREIEKVNKLLNVKIGFNWCIIMR